jgi:hypothetical protein
MSEKLDEAALPRYSMEVEDDAFGWVVEHEEANGSWVRWSDIEAHLRAVEAALQQAQATIPHLQALVKSGDVKRVLDAAQQHADDEHAWRNVFGPAYFESNLGRCENRRKLRVAIQELAALLSSKGVSK